MLKGPCASWVANSEFFTYSLLSKSPPESGPRFPLSSFPRIRTQFLRKGNPESTDTWLPTTTPQPLHQLTTAVFFIRTKPAEDRDSPAYSDQIEEWTSRDDTSIRPQLRL